MGQVLKYVFFVFNFLFWILGLVAMGLGIAARVKSKDFESLLGNNTTLSTAMNILIVAGVFVAIIGFFGCCGAIKSNKTLLIIYAALVVLVFILEIAAGVLAYTKKDKVINTIVASMKTEVGENYGKPRANDAAKAIDRAVDWLQKKLSCCGVAGGNDYKNNTAWKKASNSTTGALKVPASCCVNANGISCPLASAHKDGCQKKVTTFLKEHIWQIGGAAIGIAFVQIIAVVIATVLIRSIEHHHLG